MVIGTCGFGSSGSSVISDYLKEFEMFQILDDVEFILPYCPDGLQQLDFVLNQAPVRNESSYVALFRFEHMVKKILSKGTFVKQSKLNRREVSNLCDEFLQTITQCKWNGFIGTETYTCGNFYRLFGISIMKQRVIPFFEHRTGKMWKKRYPYHEIRMSVCPSNFDMAAKQFVNSILCMMGADNNRNIVLDQPFPGDDPQSCMKYFDDPIAIVVDRDPRDTYIFLQTRLKNRGAFMPYDNVRDYVKYYRSIREKRPYSKSKDERVLLIQFEDMIYHYEETTGRLRSFSNLPSNPNPKTIFIPEMSMANTQLFHRFPDFQKDVKYIEQELEDYLYDYSGCPLPKSDAKMFFGKSPLNR